MPVGSFAFRVSCYEQFGWSPADVAALSMQEAHRLAIYFEELGAHNYRQNKKSSSGQSSSYNNTQDKSVVELELQDPYYDDPDWWKDE